MQAGVPSKRLTIPAKRRTVPKAFNSPLLRMKPFLPTLSFLTVVAVASVALPAGALNQQGVAAPPAYLKNASSSAALEEIDKLLDAKVDVEVIRAYIQNSPVSFRLSASDLIALKDRGASAEILKALIEHQPQAAVVTAPAPQAPGPQTAPNYPMGPAVEAPMTGSDYGYGSYPVYGNNYYPSYPYYYPSYAYASYGWPYFYFGYYPGYCYSRGYGGYWGHGYGHYPYYGYGHYPYSGHYYGHGGLTAIHSTHGGTFAGTHSGTFMGSGGFHSGGTFHTSTSGFHGGGGFQASNGGFHSGGGGGGGFHGGGGGGGSHGGGGGGHR